MIKRGYGSGYEPMDTADGDTLFSKFDDAIISSLTGYDTASFAWDVLTLFMVICSPAVILKVFQAHLEVSIDTSRSLLC